MDGSDKSTDIVPLRPKRLKGLDEFEAPATPRKSVSIGILLAIGLILGVCIGLLIPMPN